MEFKLQGSFVATEELQSAKPASYSTGSKESLEEELGWGGEPLI